MQRVITDPKMFFCQWHFTSDGAVWQGIRASSESRISPSGRPDFADVAKWADKGVGLGALLGNPEALRIRV